MITVLQLAALLTGIDVRNLRVAIRMTSTGCRHVDV